MSRRAWLTPDSLPTETNCFQVLVPDSLYLEAVFRGALLLLAEVSNWEQVGTTTPQECADLFADLLDSNLNMVPCSGGGEMHIGSVFWFASATPPTGCLVCDGSLYDVSAYPELYSVLGLRWGGDGSTFAVPDLRGRFLRSLDTGLTLGYWDGTTEETLTVAQLPAHSHDVKQGVSSGGLPIQGASVTPRFSGTFTTESAGSNQAHNNLPPYHILVAMIQAS